MTICDKSHQKVQKNREITNRLINLELDESNEALFTLNSNDHKTKIRIDISFVIITIIITMIITPCIVAMCASACCAAPSPNK